MTVPLLFPAAEEPIPPPMLPDLRPVIERELVEWDWRMQDGIGTERESRTWQEAAETVLQRGDRLTQDLKEAGVDLAGARRAVGRSPGGAEFALGRDGSEDESRWEDLWRRIHVLRRRIALANPLADVGPLAFVKRVPSGFSHQLTQYGGRCARPGGGVFVLEAPGESMRCRRLASLPTGSPLHLDVSCDGRRVLFAFCEIELGAQRLAARTTTSTITSSKSAPTARTSGNSPRVPTTTSHPATSPMEKSSSSPRAGAAFTAVGGGPAPSTRWPWPMPTAPIRG